MHSSQLSRIASAVEEPIDALGLLAQALRTRTSAEGDVATILHDMDLGLSQLRRQIASLLDLVRTDQYLDHCELSVFPLMPLFERLALRSQRPIQETGARLKIVGTTACVRSDQAAVGVILHNLLINAAFFSPGGRVVLGCRRRESAVEVQVCDNGTGVAPEHLERIFEPLEKLKGDGDEAVEGLGLGLALARELAASLGHALVLRSETGRGTVAALSLPIAHPAEEPLPGSAEGERALRT